MAVFGAASRGAVPVASGAGRFKPADAAGPTAKPGADPVNKALGKLFGR